LHTEIERALMPHMFNTGKYREKKIKKININQELILNPKSILWKKADELLLMTAT
jgi:hypothetical protein